jgi:hypothetical protein
MQIGIEDSGDNLLTREIGSMIKGYALRTLQLMRMPILWWIGNAAWKALYDGRGNPQAVEFFIAGNVMSGRLSC